MDDYILEEYKNALRIAREQNIKLKNELEWYKTQHNNVYNALNYTKSCIKEVYKKCKKKEQYGKCWGLKKALFILEGKILIEREKK